MVCPLFCALVLIIWISNHSLRRVGDCGRRQYSKAVSTDTRPTCCLRCPPIECLYVNSRHSSFQGSYFGSVGLKIQDVVVFMSLRATDASCAGEIGVYDGLFNDGRVVGADEKCEQRATRLTTSCMPVTDTDTTSRLNPGLAFGSHSLVIPCGVANVANFWAPMSTSLSMRAKPTAIY